MNRLSNIKEWSEWKQSLKEVSLGELQRQLKIATYTREVTTEIQRYQAKRFIASLAEKINSQKAEEYILAEIEKRSE